MGIISLLARIRISFGSFRININNPIVWVGSAIIVIFFIRSWGIKRLFWFCVVTALSLFLMIKTEAFIIEKFGEEGGYYSLLVKPIFIFIIAFTFVYIAFVKKEQ